MKDLQLFQNEQFGQLRGHVDENDQPWFCAKDIAVSLDYTSTNMPTIFAAVPEEWKGSRPIATPGGSQEMLCLAEQGVYFFLGRSDKPKALPYQRWVAGEIIPAIRRHGGYLTPEKVEEALLSPDTIIRLATDLKQARAEKELLASRHLVLMAEHKALELRAEADRPRVIFSSAVEASKSTVLVRELAKYLKQNGVDIGQNRLFGWLREHGYLIRAKAGDDNQPTQKAMDMGLFEIKKTVVIHSNGHESISVTTRVTGKGQLYFVNKFLGGPKAPALN
jgi:anti-repressor protein